MDLLPDEAQQAIIEQTAGFLDESMPLERMRTAGPEAARPDAALLSQMAELGWFGLALPEDRGGVGFSLAEEALLFREIGRRAGSVGLLAATLAAHLADGADRDDLRDSIVAGAVRVGYAERASRSAQVFDGDEADLWIAISPDRAVLIDPAGVPRDAKPCLDEHTQLLVAELEAAEPVARAGPRLFEHAAILAANMLCGLAEAARDQASQYAQERVQFGKPIGVFQAIKHPCADMAVRCEAATSQALYAALALRDGHAHAAFQVSAAKSIAGEAALANARANVQVHGGYGFTTEYDAHVLVKRSHILNAIAGTPPWHDRRVLEAPDMA